MAEREKGRELRGGTERGELARELDAEHKGEGTPGTTAPSGGTHVEAPSQSVPRTGLADRPTEGVGLLAGGKTREQVMGYLSGVTFPAKKDTLVRTAHRNGAPEDVLGALRMLGQ